MINKINISIQQINEKLIDRPLKAKIDAVIRAL